jgi:hypothetical protein
MESYGWTTAKTAAGGVNIEITEELVKEILKRVRKGGGAEKRWDVNRVEGELAETALAKLLDSDGTTIEVKREFLVSQTGNVTAEFACSGRPSGIATSAAEWWAYALDGDNYNGEVVVLIKKKRLERLLIPTRIVRGGDKNSAGKGRAEMFLIRTEELTKPLKGTS